MDIIFDFDGTISNSIIGIQDSFDKAFLQVFKENNTVDLYSMIGPPIHLILLKVRPETTNEESNLFVQLFRNNYDEQGHQLNSLYPDILEVLSTLKTKGHRLHIATFKRRTPLIKILETYKIISIFESIYTYDKEDGQNYNSKSDMVSEMLITFKINKNSCTMVGDSNDDAKAAEENNICFIFAAYGYGKDLKAAHTIYKTTEILDIINTFQSPL